MEGAWMCVFTFFTVFQTNMAYRPEDWKGKNFYLK